MSTSTDPERLLDGLDPEQREVATTLHGPLAVIAGAGTGKTRAITHRIAYGVAVGAYQANTVLAVTFTTRAAGEMRGRLQQLGVRAAQARTFHSAALRQAQYFWPRVHGSELPRIADNRMGMVAEAASRLRVRTDTATLRDLVGEIGWSKVSNVDPDDYVRVAATQHRELASVDAATVARVFAGYEKVKTDRGRIDFEDILLCTAALLSDHDDVRAEVHRTYRHFVVDEYQDVSPLQETLLGLWRGDRSDVCVVGDPAQTIHSFAGARADYLTGFARRHRDATVVRLVRDYRSTPQVVQVANQVMAGPPGSGGRDASGRLDAVRLVAQRPDGPEIGFAECPDEADEAAAVAQWCADRHAGGTEWREMAVLFRINAQSPAFEQALTEREVPYLVRGGERFYERPEVRQAMIALRAEANHGGEEGAGRTATEGVRLVLDAIGWTENAPTGAGATRERWESLAALVTVAEDLAEDAGLAAAPTLSDLVAELERRAQAQHVPVAQGVTLATLHSAKGLEWDAVALVGVQDGTLPFSLATTPAEIAEERRLLYVGVTRAREHLRVSWSRRRSGSGGTRNASRFLTGIRPQTSGTTETAAAGSARRKSRTSVLSARCRTCNQLLTDASERKLGRHADCPATYDEHTLELLKQWRKQEATEQDLPAYCVFTDATLIAIAEARPASSRDLIKVHGLGQTKLDRYGEHVLAIVTGAVDGSAAADEPEMNRAQK